MIKWEDRSNALAAEWWSLTIGHTLHADVSRDAGAPWRVAIVWHAGDRDRFDLPAHWTDAEAKADTLRFLAPRLAAFAAEVAAAVQGVADAIDAAAAAR